MTGSIKPATGRIKRVWWGPISPILGIVRRDRPPWRANLNRLKDPTAMLHFSCDVCGKDLISGVSTRFVVKMEAFAAGDPAELTEEDTDPDHVEEMARLLNEQEETGEDSPTLLPACKKMRFDLCRSCYRKFLDDPLGREAAKLHFSEN